MSQKNIDASILSAGLIKVTVSFEFVFQLNHA
jgi:hypothetical protein